MNSLKKNHILKAHTHVYSKLLKTPHIMVNLQISNWSEFIFNCSATKYFFVPQYP